MIDIAVEVGEKRVIATAIEWPGWCRGGRDKDSALAALIEYGPRYAAVVKNVASGFAAPKEVKALRVGEHLKGNATTDFGAPAMHYSGDSKPLSDMEFDRIVSILQACWSAFEAASAKKVTLRSGPRGGGRDLEKMKAHVFEADGMYLVKLGAKFTGTDMTPLHKAFVQAMEARVRGEVPDVGPRGGTRWSARYAARRSAWHALDHLWEIEDRRS